MGKNVVDHCHRRQKSRPTNSLGAFDAFCFAAACGGALRRYLELNAKHDCFKCVIMIKFFIKHALIIGSKVASVAFYPPLRLMNKEYRQFIPAIKDPILTISATDLARKIRKKEITSEEVVKAYILRCCLVNPIINAIVNTRYEVALAEAKNADTLLSSGSYSIEELEKRYPLFGVPITIKESFYVKGMPFQGGVCINKPFIPERDAESVLRLKEAGGIPILVSNTPEFCLNWETFNYVTGTTKNPYNTRKTAGGSSGGEAALLASAASVIGLGSDSAGSLRLPAHYNGIFSHKPTPLAVSLDSHFPSSSMKDWPYKAAVGPMTRYAEDLTLMLKVLNDPNGFKLDLDKKVSLKNIRFFYMEGDDCGFAEKIDSDTKKAFKNLIRYFDETHGITVKKAKLKHMKYTVDACFTNLLRVEDLTTPLKQPLELGPVTFEVLKKICGKSHIGSLTLFHAYLRIMANNMNDDIFEEAALCTKQLKSDFTDLLKDDAVCFYPTFKTTATLHYDYLRHIKDYSYLTLFNSLGLPVTNCPLGLTSSGMPVGVQIVTSPGCDHLSIFVAKQLEKAFGGWIPPPEAV